MGSKMAPNLACIFMDWLEQTHLPNAPVKPLIWKRYIDDVFAVFICTDEELEKFTEWINSIHPTIKFTCDSNPSGIPFLDTFVTIRDNKLVTKPHTKPTDNKQYILPSSCHPKHIIRSIPYSQALRIKRICTDHQTLIEELENLRGYFLNRKYSPHIVNDAINKVLRSPTQAHKTAPPTKTKQEQPIPSVLVVTFHPNNPPFQATINDIWLKYEKLINQLIGKPLVAYKRPPNLKDMLTKARFGKCAIPVNRDPTHTVSKRPLNTYDKQQLLAPIKHVLFQCSNQHHELFDHFDNLNEAINSLDYQTFSILHQKCGAIKLLPVNATHEVSIKCTECKFNQKIMTNRTEKEIKCEMLNICDTHQKALHREVATHVACNNKCKTCAHIWYSPSFTDPSGTHYRLKKFNCKATHVVYVIYCTRCNIHYVGMTTNTLKQRFSNHMSCIKNWRNTSVANHFIQAGHHADLDLKIGIIDEAPNNINNLRIREGFWINALQAVSKGINQREESNLSLNYQLISIAKHFRHSLTCAPYIICTLKDIHTNDLHRFRRVMLKPRGSASASRITHTDQRQAAPHDKRAPRFFPLLKYLNSAQRKNN